MSFSSFLRRLFARIAGVRLPERPTPTRPAAQDADEEAPPTTKPSRPPPSIPQAPKETPPVATASPVEPFAEYEPPIACSTTPKPGAVALRRIVLSLFGGKDLGISRECAKGGLSEHHEGRAWDWGQPTHEAAEDCIAWLLRTENGEEAANARRLGIMYLIYNRRMWRAYTRGDRARGWSPYQGASPHTDHVHFSLSRSGAAAETSGYNGGLSAVVGGAGGASGASASSGAGSDALAGAALLGLAAMIFIYGRR